MSLKELKLEPLDRVSQAILFDESGQILESDDVLFQLDKAKDNLFNDTILAGMDDQLSVLTRNQEIELECINADFYGKKSIFDIKITKITSAGEHQFLLLIYDFGKQYNKTFELQQERNVAQIQNKKFEKENQVLKFEKDTIENLYKELLKEEDDQQFILIKSDNLLINTSYDDILYIEAYGDYVKVYTQEKVYVTYKRISSVEESLPSSQFSRIHRSYIIRLDKIKNIEQFSVQIGEEILPIGKSYKQGLVEKMKHL